MRSLCSRRSLRSCRVLQRQMWAALILMGATLVAVDVHAVAPPPLLAGAAKVDVSHPEHGPPDGPLFVKALVLRQGETTAVLLTIDAVAIAEIGGIRNEYLGQVRERLQRELQIPPTGVVVNASHCHGIVCADIVERTVEAVRLASAGLAPVQIRVGAGSEDRVSENRRMRLKSGRQADVRHAYSLPPDEEIAEVGPIDPEIGVLRLDRVDGRALAVVYNFACHPIQGVPNGRNTSDMTGFASQVIEDNLDEGAIALFVQGCAGDINPAAYKDADNPRDAEPLGNVLGLSTLKAARTATPSARADLRLIHGELSLPRADLTARIAALETEQTRLMQSLRGTSLDFKTFLPLMVKYQLFREFPADSSHRYLHERMLGRAELEGLDEENRRNLDSYLRNIVTMEELTRTQVNLALLKKHQAQYVAAASRTLEVEVLGMRVGDFVLVTFPGELTVQIGLGIKERSPHPRTFVAGYTNGYIYYAPTEEQLANSGAAQEDCDCILGAGWQQLFEQRVAELLEQL